MHTNGVMTTTEQILVVDDDESTRDALAELLGADGYDVVTAANGIEALDRIHHATPSVVVCDVRMPRGGGLELVQKLRLRNATAHVPVIMISAAAGRDRRLEALSLGADDFVAKPIDIDELKARIQVQLRHVHHQRELERRSSLDPLTGVLNRRGLTAELKREQARSVREGTALSVLVVDIDGFKGINDSYGHKIGDTALRLLARTISDEVRTIDHVGRIGGDEFVVLAPGADPAAAGALAHRLRQIALPIAVGDHTDLRVTISVGDATLQPDESIDELLDRADRAMYLTKRR